MNERARKLAWSKEVERRVRDLYKRAFPDAQRAKFMGREDREGHPDIVGVPFHVQVKARSHTWVTKEWEAAHRANQTAGVTHLVVQDAGKQPLLVMKLEDWINERVRDTGRGSMEGPQGGGHGPGSAGQADPAVPVAGTGTDRVDPGRGDEVGKPGDPLPEADLLGSARRGDAA